MKKQIFTAVACLLFVGVLTACTTPEPTPVVSNEPVNDPTPDVGSNFFSSEIDGFLIENGVLISYTGSETDLVLPDQICAILDTSFDACADKITSITLGNNVRYITPLAFSDLSNLTSVYISKGNPYLTQSEYALIDRSNSLVIATTHGSVYSQSALITTLQSIASGELSLGNQFCFVTKKAIITVAAQENPEYILNNANPRFLLHATAIDFKGIHLDITKGKELLSDTRIGFLQTDDAFLYWNGFDGYRDIYLLTEGAAYDISNHISSDEKTNYNDTVYRYFFDENEKLAYVKTPNKYVMRGGWLDPICYCTGLNEPYQEDGYVTIQNGNVIHVPTTLYTAGEMGVQSHYDSRIASIKESGDYDDEYIKDLMEMRGRPRCNSLEELLAYNKEHYPSWQPTEGTIVEMSENVYVDVDGTVIISSIGSDEGRMADQRFASLYNKLTVELPCSEITKILVGGAVIELENNRFARSVTALGHTLEFSGEELPVDGNFKFQAFEAGDCFILANTVNGRGVSYVFTPVGVTKISTPLNDGKDEGSSSVGRFYADGDTLCYIRFPSKFSGTQVVGQWMEKCVSREEFFSETGTITFDGNHLVVSPVETKRICDALDVDELFAQWRNTANLDPNLTTDEFLAQNALKYKRAY